ncbi:hypothetical protein EDC04DRAFT_980173 [Pisolithus marmoratus]|nr:hypothetical protein EDC04DRAFT_980173 [Pisolithus marmoratus]
MLGSKFRDLVVATSSNDGNSYRRCQAFQLLSVILNQHSQVCVCIPRGTYTVLQQTTRRSESLQKTVLGLANGAVDDQCTSQLKDLLKAVFPRIGQTRKSNSSAGKEKTCDSAAWNGLYIRLAPCVSNRRCPPEQVPSNGICCLSLETCNAERWWRQPQGGRSCGFLEKSGSSEP